MAEQVVTVAKLTAKADQRALAMLERGGRTRDPRTRDAVFDILVAGKARYGFAVKKHVCRHDEGISDCSSGVIEG